MTTWFPGDVVLTTYGVGVVVSCPVEGDTEKTLDVRLWRNPGKSVGSTATAYLQPDTIIMKLPAAPGMTTMLMIGEEEQPVTVHAFYSSSHSYLVSPVTDGEPQYTQVDGTRLKQAPSAKFYPLLVELMKRGDRTANATAAILQDEEVTKIVNKGAKYMESKTEEATAKSKENVDKLTSTVTTAVTENLPKEQEVQQVYSMLKDEELTVLLKKGQDRLKELMATDVSKATKDTLKKAGIVIAEGDDDASSFSQAVSKSRDVALSSLEELLRDADVDPNDLDAIRGKLTTNFTEMFDSMSQAAKSDRALNSIFENLAGKTSAWQQATGRLMSTKSGSLFMEGATRLQQRAQDIFSKGQVDWAGEVGTKLTKAFTEGDAAVARLKSIEMGDAVRNRLVDAIEVRSGSQGGLDGIIAGALTTITSSGEGSGDKMQSLLTTLQTNASGKTTEARETLISVLSNRSQYQDIAMMRIEKVMCDLDKHLGDEMTPAEIAAIASGKDGTAALFEPVAKRASKEISKHLDQAEDTVTDPAIQTALQHVRRIVSGELTAAGLMDEVVTILNDNTIVAAGENLVKHGEFALDAIEGISGNKIAGDVMQIAEKAGITKESVMSQLESLNVNEILDTAGNAMSDEKARRELVSSATDTALDFVLRILPSMPVPPLDGVKDGLLYNLSNLSMQGFKVKKEDIMVEIAGMRATKHLQKQKAAASKSGATLATLESEKASSAAWSFGHTDSNESGFEVDMTAINSDRKVKATELLIIDVQGISAILEHVEWGFEQTYMPYLKGSGKADVKFSDGSIRLQFELRKRLKTLEDSGETVWEPVLCMNDRSCAIEQVDLVLQGESRLTWIFNKLAAVFKNVLRDYVVKTIINVLTVKSGYILQQLNDNLAPYWGLILRTTGLKMDELIEADKDVIIASQPDEDEDLVELVWRENLPLGMNLLLNDDSGKLKVVDFPRGSQARAVCSEKELEPEIFNGAIIVAVNGSRYDFQEDLFDALKNPARPKSILFELANPDDAARVKNFVEGSRGRKSKKKDAKKQESEPRVFATHDVVFEENAEIGLEFMPSVDGYGLAVKGFFEGDDGIVLASERDGSIQRDDLLTHINGKLVLGENGKGQQRALELLEQEGSTRPLTLTFSPPYLFLQVFEKESDGIADLGGPMECKLEEKNKRVVLHDFENSNGTAESGGVLIGDYLVFINGQPVGAGCALMGLHQPPELSEIYTTLRNPASYPAALTFARPKQQTGSRWTSSAQKFSIEDSETICITADSFEQIGCVFASHKNLDIVVSDLFAVPGPLQTAMRPHVDRNGKLDLAIDSINGQFVPSYATNSIVMNAMKRSWSSNNKVEIVFCDDERKGWVQKLA